MKRGVTTQIFIFIFALLMIALVLLFGIRSLTTVKETADKVELLTFVDSFSDVVQEYAVFDVGSSELIRLSVPAQVRQVCFVSPKLPVTTSIPSDLRFFIENNEKDNLYVLPLEVFTAPAPDFAIDDLFVDPATNPLCVNTGGMLQVKLETVLVDDNIFVQVTEK